MNWWVISRCAAQLFLEVPFAPQLDFRRLISQATIDAARRQAQSSLSAFDHPRLEW